MRGKRSKQYRKLMQQYGLTFGFREPYQVLIDAGMLEAAVVQYKMDLVKSLSRTLHGEVKPMLTQCTIRQLYNLPTTSSQSQLQTQPQSQTPKAPQNSKTKSSTPANPAPMPPTLTSSDKTAIINLAKTFEKRRCDHADHEQPLSTHACISSVIDPKDSQTNKHRYVIAVQDEQARDWARSVRGVPSVYVRRSVMIMEPMTEASMNVKVGAEKEKLRGGVKRKRGDEQEAVGKQVDGGEGDAAQEARKKKKVKGQKGVNPLSMQKPKKREVQQPTRTDGGGEDEGSGPKKRRRKHKGAAATSNEAGVEVDAE